MSKRCSFWTPDSAEDEPKLSERFELDRARNKKNICSLIVRMIKRRNLQGSNSRTEAKEFT